MRTNQELVDYAADYFKWIPRIREIVLTLDDEDWQILKTEGDVNENHMSAWNRYAGIHNRFQDDDTKIEPDDILRARNLLMDADAKSVGIDALMWTHFKPEIALFLESVDWFQVCKVRRGKNILTDEDGNQWIEE